MDNYKETQDKGHEAGKSSTVDAKQSWTDSEIRSKGEDKFDFKDYARILFSRVLGADPPLTIGVFGSWGSGKTSLMRLIEEEFILNLKADQLRIIEHLPDWSGRAELQKSIEKSPGGKFSPILIKALKYLWQIEGELQEIETIWINVWQLSNQEEVWQAFLQALFNRVNRKLPWWRRIQWRKLVRELLVNSYRIVIVIIPIILGGLIGNPNAGWEDVIHTLTNPIKNTPVGSLTSLGLALWLLVKPAVEASRTVVDFDLKSVLKYGAYKEQITELMKLQDDFATMVEDLVGEYGRLVIFIDDLDRCTPDKIPDLLEAIKLFTATPKCVYVLGLDHDIVRQGIYKKYQFEDKQEAAEYLEKIVQVPFHLPPLNEGKIEDFIQEIYPGIHERCKTAAEVFSRGLEPNPRKVKRAINIYRTLLELADNRFDSEIMNVLQSRFQFRRLHENLARNPHFLTNLQAKAKEEPTVNDLRELIQVHEKEDGFENNLVEEQDLPALLDILKRFEPELLAKVVVIQSRFRRLYEYIVRKPTFLIELQSTVSEEPSVYDLLHLIQNHVKEDKAESKWVEEIDFQALLEVFTAGDKVFPEQPWRIGDYIYLTSTAEGIAGLTTINPDEALPFLLSNDQELIQEAFEAVLKDKSKGEMENTILAVVQLLWPVYESPENQTDRDSARYALQLFQQDFEPEMVPIPSGKYTVGSSDEEIGKMIGDGYDMFVKTEKPRKVIEHTEYFIGKYPVKNSEYMKFVEDLGDSYLESEIPRTWIDGSIPDGKEDHPVVDVSWDDAMRYCSWLSRKTGKPYRLPSEDEWEIAARGEDGRLYPWGNDWDPAKCNSAESGIGETSPVGQYSSEWDSPCGVADMAGNVLEWCMDDILLEDENLQPGRGGSFGLDQKWLRCAARAGYKPGYCGESFGFRVAITTESGSGDSITIYNS